MLAWWLLRCCCSHLPLLQFYSATWKKKHVARCKRTDDLLSSLGCCCVAYLRVGAEQLLIPLYLQHRQRNKECRQENKQLKWKFRLKAQLPKDETKAAVSQVPNWSLNSSCSSDSAQDSAAIGTAKLSQLKSDGHVIWSVNSRHHEKEIATGSIQKYQRFLTNFGIQET